MNEQSYYNSLYGEEANVLNVTDDLCVNCTGVVRRDGLIGSRLKRKDYYIIYMLDGKMKLCIDEKVDFIEGGQMIIIKPDTYYIYNSETDEEIKYLWIHFSGKKAEEIISKFGLETDTIEKVGVHSGLLESWKRMFYEFVVNDKYFNEVTSCILKEILAAFSRYIYNQNGGRRFLKSIFYIHEHYSEELSVVKLAEMENVSKTYYRVRFKELTGVSPKEYIIQRRMEVACSILEDSDKSIEEVAGMVGYSDVYYFGRIFKKKIGTSPGRYRRGE